MKDSITITEQRTMDYHTSLKQTIQTRFSSVLSFVRSLPTGASYAIKR